MLADDLATGEKALQVGDYTTAAKILLPLAKQGNAAAQEDVGDMYQSGHGFPRDDKEALRWFRLAAAQGNVKAEAATGEMYFIRGTHGVRTDNAEAVRWFRLAAAQGNISSEYNLGVAYERGFGVPENHAEAVRWFRLCAENETDAPALKASALFHIGLGYFDGSSEATPLNFEEAARLFRLAADQGDEDAQLHLAALYVAGIGVPQNYVQAYMLCTLAKSKVSHDPVLQKSIDNSLAALAKEMTPSEIAEGQRLAREWKPKGQVNRWEPQ